ncbi:hypothetical protein RclHR1_04770008 [Rhizophagus clarus]|uniref:Uncharacterized protein n=1 Tax=Rhizophagus clarus TaxID=94130 RepID=A0A2Z6S0S6_9GLOM|nr:hypothetical protein RclHR1_04770008 [Rhizophagus clarus]
MFKTAKLLKKTRTAQPYPSGRRLRGYHTTHLRLLLFLQKKIKKKKCAKTASVQRPTSDRTVPTISSGIRSYILT